MAVAGCSLGAMYAANFALKYPSIFHYALCMSGRYEARHFMNGFDNSDVYLNNPLAYIPNMHGNHLQEVRANTHLSLVCGQGRWEEGCIDETRALGAWLERKVFHRGQTSGAAMCRISGLGGNGKWFTTFVRPSIELKRASIVGFEQLPVGSGGVEGKAPAACRIIARSSKE